MRADSARWAAAFSCVVSQPLRPATARQPPSARTASCGLRLTEGTAHVLPGPLLAGRAEEGGGAVVLDQVAEVHEGDVVGDPVGLLQVVGDDHDRDVVAQLDD